MKVRSVLAVEVVVLLLRLMLVPFSVALAAPANCSQNSFQNHFWGVVHDPDSPVVSGAQAYIQVGPSDLCNPPSGYAAQVFAFAGLRRIGDAGYAWVGWNRQTGDGRGVYFSYCQDCLGGSLHLITTPSLNEQDTFKTIWKNGSGEDGTIHFIFCNPSCSDFGHTTFQGSDWSDIKGIITGQTNNEDVDLPGVVGNRNEYQLNQFRHGTGAWDTYNTTVCIGHNLLGGCGGDGGTRYHLNYVDNSRFQTWTDPV